MKIRHGDKWKRQYERNTPSEVKAAKDTSQAIMLVSPFMIA